MAWPFRRRRRPAAAAPAPARVEFAWTPGRQPWLPGGTYVGVAGWTARRVTRDQALAVPAIMRGRNLICSVAALPLVQRSRDNTEVPSGFLAQIDPSVANVVTLTETIEDLVFEGVSWWQVLSYDWAGFPASARHVDTEAVSMQPPPGYPLSTLPSGLYPDGVVYVAGAPVDARNMIRFDSPNPPVCVHGATAIRRAYKLAQASEMYADDPEARAYWTPNEGADPVDDDTMREMLRAYERARRDGAEAYIPAAVTRNQSQAMSPADLTLGTLQQRSDLEIANLLGLDPEDLGVNITSRTYANAVDRRVDQVNQTLGVWMAAVSDRLSMNDVTRRGHRIVFDLTRYMQADPATRWNTYNTARQIGALDVNEIRSRENLPPLPPGAVSRETAPRVSAPAAGAQANTGPVSRETGLRVVGFDAATDGTVINFGGDESFGASTERRRVYGRLIPYGPVGTNATGRWRFAPGSVSWNRSAVSRVKLDREHDPAQLLGAATEINATDGGVSATFKVANTPSGTEALQLAADEALDGLSAVVLVQDYTADPADPTVNLVTAATLVRATLTADPAFADARVTKVAASAAGGGGPVFNTTGAPPAPAAGAPQQTQQQVAPPAPPGQQQNAAPAAGAPGQGQPPEPAAQLAAAMQAFAAAVEALNGTIPPEQRPVATARASMREPLVYQLTGQGHSFVRDAWTARNARLGGKDAEEAYGRLQKYSAQTAELAAAQTIRFANAGNTTDQADIIPPGYRPDLYVGQVPQGRPLFDAIGTRITLADATAFKVPFWVGSAGLSGTNTEGTGPSTGTITDHDYLTVTPTAQSGEFVITRELMDSSNPAIDVIARNAMQEEYAQDTEAIIAAAIAAATDDGAPVQGVSSATSTEGCYVYTVTGTGNDLAIDGIRFMEGEFPSHRFLTPNRMLASPTGYGALVRAIDDVGRPLFPFGPVVNGMGGVGQASQTLMVDGLNVPNAWSMTSTYDDILLFNAIDMLVGESPLLNFTFFEKGGPENIYLNIWGYFAFQILRYSGVHTCNFTAA